MKVLGILGSPRRGGNSEILLGAFLEGAAAAGAEVEEVMLRDLKISPCLEIYHCFKDGTCPIKDDMREVYDKLVEADVVALASPVFFYGVSAQSKAMIDRTQALWARRYILKNDSPGGSRQGVLLAVGATGGKLLFVGVRLTAKYFFDAINVSYAGEILVRGADAKGAILDQPQQLEQARDLGRRLARGESPDPIKMTPLAV
ncbi:MAG: flavodoxin family protein [Desulfobaccales bacterium]